MGECVRDCRFSLYVHHNIECPGVWSIIVLVMRLLLAKGELAIINNRSNGFTVVLVVAEPTTSQVLTLGV